MGPGTIQRTITLFQEALLGLDVDVPLIRLESLGIMVHEAMTVQARSFHTPEHIFNLADATNPIQALAALFHDVVYYEIDQGFTPEIERELTPYIEEEDGHLRLTGGGGRDDAILHLALDIFGFDDEQVLLPYQGQNEFLSALLMNKMLQGIVDPKDLAKITACIEATIPFRGENEQGESPAFVLERRLRLANANWELSMSDWVLQQRCRELRGAGHGPFPGQYVEAASGDQSLVAASRHLCHSQLPACVGEDGGVPRAPGPRDDLQPIPG
jgi:hypothetical protein